MAVRQLLVIAKQADDSSGDQQATCTYRYIWYTGQTRGPAPLPPHRIPYQHNSLPRLTPDSDKHSTHWELVNGPGGWVRACCYDGNPGHGFEWAQWLCTWQRRKKNVQLCHSAYHVLWFMMIKVVLSLHASTISWDPDWPHPIYSRIGVGVG